MRRAEQPSNRKLIVVSNRLPLTIEKAEDGMHHASPSSGGLVSAMLPVLRERGGVWVGWPGIAAEEAPPLGPILAEASETSGFGYEPVALDSDEQAGFYYGFSNEIIWPLFHDLLGHCKFEPSYWRIYQRVNAKFTEAVVRAADASDTVWVHDYHLMEVARNLKERGHQAQTGFFLHIPFPPLEIFLKLPWRFEILRSLLEFDSLGFQTIRDRRNFLQCVRTLYGVEVHGTGAVVRLRSPHEETADPDIERDIQVGSFPIGIDYRDVAQRAGSLEVTRLTRALRERMRGTHMILGVDRLDYTKGLPQKMQAFAHALETYPEMRGEVTLVQHVVPSRVEIPEYDRLRRDLEQLISEINGEFTQAGWVPIHYMFHNLPMDELLAYYRCADIALITPLKDGMNLVAKEYCASRSDEGGVLVLSEFAGSAAQMQADALLVNPYHIEQTADRLYEAFTMTGAERKERMKRLRRGIRTHDVFHWADAFVSTITSRQVKHFPMVGDYIPREQSRRR